MHFNIIYETNSMAYDEMKLVYLIINYPAFHPESEKKTLEFCLTTVN